MLHELMQANIWSSYGYKDNGKRAGSCSAPRQNNNNNKCACVCVSRCRTFYEVFCTSVLTNKGGSVTIMVTFTGSFTRLRVWVVDR